MWARWSVTRRLQRGLMWPLCAFTSTYGDYLLGKVSKVFPQLCRDVLE
jgi:hypothetical protein